MVKKAVVFHETYQAMSINDKVPGLIMRNTCQINKLHAVAVQDGRLLWEPLAKHHLSAKNFMYSALINLSGISDTVHSPPTV